MILSNKKQKILEYIKNFKSREQVPLICFRCNEDFSKPKQKIQLALNTKNQNMIYCSKKCSFEAQVTSITKPCKHCGKDVVRTKSESKRRKNHFCNQTCAAFYNNQHRTMDPSKMNRSYAESYLIGLIKNNFPQLLVQENIRKILTGGLEVDILLPRLNLAIELNGPLHYFPIYGQEKLELIKDRDIRKQVELQQLKYNLVVIDISTLSGKKKTEAFLNKYFNEKLIDIIVRLEKLT